jgi:hypothetical protein
MTDSVPVASLVGPYPDDVLALAAIIREVDGSNRMGAAGLAEAILSHSAWPALAEQFHPQEPTQPVPTPTNAPDPIAEVLPASGEDWAAVVRKAAQPDGHEARVMLEIQQRLVAVEGPIVKAKPEPEPVEQPAPPWGPWRPMHEAPKDGMPILVHGAAFGQLQMQIVQWRRDRYGWVYSSDSCTEFEFPCFYMPLPEAPKKP